MPRPPRLRLTLLSAVLASAALPAPAFAEPPGNDGYIQSTTVNAHGTALPEIEVRRSIDTREATVQTDLFTPPRTGGGAERTDCQGTSYGATVWYDFHPQDDGAVRVQAAGYDAAIAVYEYDYGTELIGRRLDCSNKPGSVEELHVEVERRKSYTIQIGGTNAGLGPAVGTLEFTFEYFADRDGDTFYDIIDDCPDEAGTSNGCPEKLGVLPTLRTTGLGTGVKVRSLRVVVPKGARVQVRCRNGCSFKQSRTALRAGPVSFPKLRNRVLPAGARLEVFVTKANSIGTYISYAIRRGTFKSTLRCLRPGSMTPRKSCR